MLLADKNNFFLKQIIETVATETGRLPQMVEKDILQSMFLREISDSETPFVFKGGTSLSKIYGLINRFSEDIDLSSNKKMTDSDKKKAHESIMQAANKMNFILTNPDDVKSRYSYNKYLFSYQSLVNDPMEIIIETSFYKEVYPANIKPVHSIIEDFCQKNSISLPIQVPQEIKILSQSLERTFIDKIFAICDYRLQNMQDRDSRHLYDIAKILPHIQVTDELYNLVWQVREDRMQSKNNPSAQPEHDIPKMLEEIICSRFYEQDYKNITSKLLYEQMSYDEAINNGISIVAKMDLFNTRIKSNNPDSDDWQGLE